MEGMLILMTAKPGRSTLVKVKRVLIRIKNIIEIKFPDCEFIIGGIVGLIIIFLRHYFHESEEFLKSRKDHKSADYNFFYLAKIIKKCVYSLKFKFFLIIQT
jgi:hypothetical protein